MLQPDLKQEKFCTPPSRHSGRYTHEITTCHVGIGFGLLPPRKQIPHRNWLETTTETSKFVKITSFVSRNLKLFVWNSESFPTSVLYIYTYIYITLYTCSFFTYVFFKYIYNIILGYRCLRLAGYIPELECRSVTAEQVLQIKNYAVPSLGFAKNESDLFSAWYRGRAISNKALLLVANNYDSVNSELRRVFEKEM